MDLGSKGVRRDVVPELDGATVDVNNLVVTGDHVVRTDVTKPNVREDSRGQSVDARIEPAVVGNRREGRDIRPAGFQLPCTTVPILVARRGDRPRADRIARRVGGRDIPIAASPKVAGRGIVVMRGPGIAVVVTRRPRGTEGSRPKVGVPGTEVVIGRPRAGSRSGTGGVVGGAFVGHHGGPGWVVYRGSSCLSSADNVSQPPFQTRDEGVRDVAQRAGGALNRLGDGVDFAAELRLHVRLERHQLRCDDAADEITGAIPCDQGRHDVQNTLETA